MMEKITSYKGFKQDMTCSDFQYKEGESYEEPSAKACERGFHACEYPLDCLGYYSPNESVYHVVEQSGEISRHSDDTKVASTKIKIGAEINIAGLVKAAIEYTMKRVNPEAKADERQGASSAGDSESVAVAWGYHGKAKGVLGSYLVLADWEGDEDDYWHQNLWQLKGAKMVQVDGKDIKPDTFYTMRNGEIIEAED
nr:MAG TPA: hypothetical protein [Caudoviricetes sp.]